MIEIEIASCTRKKMGGRKTASGKVERITSDECAKGEVRRQKLRNFVIPRLAK